MRSGTGRSESENYRAAARRPLWAIFLGSGVLVVLLAGLCRVSGLDLGLGPAPVIVQTLPVTTPLCGTWHTTSTARVYDGGLNAIATLSGTDVWTVGVDQNAPLIQHWNGIRWQTIASGAPSDARLMAIAGTRADDLWAAGYTDSNGQGHSTVVHWDGHKWQRSAVPQTGERGSMLLGLTATSPTDVWAVGRYTSLNDGLLHPLILHWNGNQWSRSGTTDLPPSIGSLHAVVALAADNVWAVGSTQTQIQLTTLGRQYPVSGSASYIVHWDGTRWTRVASPNPGYAENELLSVVAGAGGQLWALGSYSNDASGNRASTLALRWKGGAWERVPSPDGNPQSSNSLNSAVVVGPNDVWAVGEHRGTNGFGVRALILHWDGSTWSLVPRPEPQSNQSLNGITTIPGQGLWAVGWSTAKDGIQFTMLARFLPGFCSSPPPTLYPD